MKYRHSAALLAAMGMALAMPAFAQQAEPEEAGRAASKAKPDDRFCIKETGSRVVATRNRNKKADEECVIGNGRVYTREDILRTGSVDIKDALRRLDPSVW